MCYQEKWLPLQSPRCDLLLPLGQTQNLKQQVNKNQTYMGTQRSAWRHRKIKPSSYYSFMISNSGALSYAGASVESALLRSTAFQSPPMGSVIQWAPFVPMVSELLMDEHQERLPHVLLFHTYFNLNEYFCSLPGIKRFRVRWMFPIGNYNNLSRKYLKYFYILKIQKQDIYV